MDLKSCASLHQEAHRMASNPWVVDKASNPWVADKASNPWLASSITSMLCTKQPEALSGSHRDGERERRKIYPLIDSEYFCLPIWGQSLHVVSGKWFSAVCSWPGNAVEEDREADRKFFSAKFKLRDLWASPHSQPWSSAEGPGWEEEEGLKPPGVSIPNSHTAWLMSRTGAGWEGQGLEEVAGRGSPP